MVGSALMDLLYGKSILAVVLFSLVLQLAALPVLWFAIKETELHWWNMQSNDDRCFPLGKLVATPGALAALRALTVGEISEEALCDDPAFAQWVLSCLTNYNAYALPSGRLVSFAGGGRVSHDHL
jgi:hypothetical protein